VLADEDDLRVVALAAGVLLDRLDRRSVRDVETVADLEVVGRDVVLDHEQNDRQERHDEADDDDRE
jgi:hypothetical protein